MKGFRVEGELHLGRAPQRFAIELACANVLEAKHRAQSIFGSRHRVKRAFVRIKNIRELTFEEVQDPTVAHVLRAGPKKAGMP